MYGISIVSPDGDRAYLIACQDDEDGEGMYNMLDAMSTIDGGFYYQHKKNWDINTTWKWIANQFDVRVLDSVKSGSVRGLYLGDPDLDGALEYTDYNASVGPDSYVIYTNNVVKGFDEYYKENSKVYDMPDNIYESWNFDGDIELDEEKFYEFLDKFQMLYTPNPGRLYIRHGDEKYTMYFPEGNTRR